MPATPGREAGSISPTQFFFTLAEPSDAAHERLIDACKHYLSGHDDEMYFWIGSRAPQMRREVNIQDFDVSLHIVFDSVASHDRYQTHTRHLEFVEKNNTLWTGVRVFDSYLDGQPPEDPNR